MYGSDGSRGQEFGGESAYSGNRPESGEGAMELLAKGW